MRDRKRSHNAVKTQEQPIKRGKWAAQIGINGTAYTGSEFKILKKSNCC